MKIGKIKQKDDVYTIQLIPNLIEKLFGKKEEYREYKLIKDEIFLTGGGCYIRKDGIEVENWSQIQVALDKFRRSWQMLPNGKL